MAAKPLIICAFAVALLAPGGVRSAVALSAPPGLEGAWDADREAIEALAIYPEDVRRSVLEASTHPEVLARIESIRAWSNRDFRALLADSPREEQARLWDLVRYPELVAELVAGGRKSPQALKRIVADYPEEIRETALECAREHFDLLVEIDALHRNADEAFEDLIADYPAQTRAAFAALLALPEVMSILTDRMRTTALLGEAYERDPEGVEAFFAELHLEVARRNAESVEAWRRDLEEEPELREEFEASAQVFAEENGYDSYAPPTETVVHHYVHPYPYYYVEPYPYWFGFPFWISVGFSYPVWHASWFWYPRPYWAHTGFYYGHGHRLVVFAAPSFHYLNWHFSSHRDHPRFPLLSTRIAHHFETHYRWHHGERKLSGRRHRDVREVRAERRWYSERRPGEKRLVGRATHWSLDRDRALERRGDAARRDPGAGRQARARDRRPESVARGRKPPRETGARRAEERSTLRRPGRVRPEPLQVAKADRAKPSPARVKPARQRDAEAHGKRVRVPGKESGVHRERANLRERSSAPRRIENSELRPRERRVVGKTDHRSFDRGRALEKRGDAGRRDPGPRRQARARDRRPEAVARSRKPPRQAAQPAKERRAQPRPAQARPQRPRLAKADRK